MGIFYYNWDLLKHFYIFVRGVHIARHIVERITAFCLVTLPTMGKQQKLCSKIDQIIVNNNLT